MFVSQLYIIALTFKYLSSPVALDSIKSFSMFSIVFLGGKWTAMSPDKDQNYSSGEIKVNAVLV